MSPAGSMARASAGVRAVTRSAAHMAAAASAASGSLGFLAHALPLTADDLPPGQYLMMEVLAARYRLGENDWTFPSGHARIARELAGKGLVHWQSGVAERTIRVRMTDAGRHLFLSPTYQAPTLGD